MGADDSTATVRELGEFALIARINAGRAQAPGVLLGPGDDAAVLAAPDGRLAVTTDMLVQNRHFRLDWSAPAEIGRKAIAQNAADVVAMGAVPTAFVVALGCPGETPVAVIDGLTAGMWAEAGRACGASIAGGDLVRSPELVISVTAFGDLEGRAPVLRSGSRAGDVVAVAGRLGWSAAGLDILLAETPASPRVGPGGWAAEAGATPNIFATGAGRAAPIVGAGDGRGARAAGGDAPEAGLGTAPRTDALRTAALAAHRAPRPPYPAVLDALRAGARPTAMADTSDGLLADLAHIAEASGVAVDLDSAALADPALAELATALEHDAAQWILTGGEDHAFVATWPAETELPPGWRAIGRVTAGSGVTVDGAGHAGPRGWESFSGAESPPVGDPR
ncbi:thiamine-monophosphate kinase [Nocardia asteroides]|nr:thiamine-monophosphate kinase [Nocardia asteroides]UGT64896.1 thiamine-monophosphate kinase [Nocardia asteroides]